MMLLDSAGREKPQNSTDVYVLEAILKLILKIFGWKNIKFRLILSFLQHLFKFIIYFIVKLLFFHFLSWSSL